MRKIFPKLLLCCTMMILFSLASFSQNAITGKVTDSKDGNPVVGATVTVKGTKTATQTATDGTYSINAPANATLVFSSVGFAVMQVNVSGRTADVSLVQINQQLDELVVVAYGSRRKGDLTSSITAVTAKDFQKGNIASSEQLLQGKVAGLQITSGGGSAGGGSTIRIRGGASLNANNDPLIVIDGVPVDNNNLPGSANLLNTINPNDIESMSVLKDASATALYGSRASNGVIIITTKKGTKGKIRFNFNTQVSAGMVGKKVDVLSADEIRTIINADAAAPGGTNTFKNLLGTANTDWQDEIYQTAIGNDNNISASGAFKNIPFRVSLGYLTQDGILKTNHFNRLSTSLNLSPKFFNDHLAVNLNLKYANTKNSFADEGAVGSAASFDPTQEVTNGSKWGGYFEWLQPGTSNPIDLSTRNPLALLKLRDNTSKVNRIVGSVQLDYKLHFFPDLHIQANLGLDYAKGSGNDKKDSIMATDYKTAGRYTYYKQSKQNTLTELSLFYTKDIKSIKSKIDVLALHGYQDFLTNVNNYASFGQNGVVIATSVPSFATDKPRYRLESYLGRINYSYNNKYFLSASIRRDASSKFSPDTRVGYFPAVSAAWKLKDDFFKNSNVISDLKLRGSWGITGQQDIAGTGGSFNPLYPYLPVYAYSNSAAQYQFGTTYFNYLRPGAYDPNIKWETTTTTNFGLDFGFLNNRISGSIDVYNKKTKDLLARKDMAPGQNFDISIVTNIGDLENKGVEFVLNTTPVKTKSLTWDFGFNIAYNSMKITDLGTSAFLPTSGISGGTGNTIGVNAVGYAPAAYKVYQQVYDPATGKPIEGLYEDMNRDGVVDTKDQYYYKKPAPDVLLGINTQVSYKKWSLGLAGHGAFGYYLYNNYNSNSGVLRSIKNPINFIGNASSDYLKTGFVNNQYFSDYYVENASYFRLDNINIGYNAGQVFNKRATLRISASVQNVFVITKYSGLDPENSNTSNTSNLSGVDNNIYPRPRVFSLGANLDF